MSIVVDASVAIKWVLDEDPVEDTAAARRIVGRFTVAVPPLFDFELASILWAKRKRGLLTGEHCDAAALALQTAPIRRVANDGLWLRALSLADEVGHPPYDCAYVAAALAIGADAVVTADARFVRAFTQWRAPHVSVRRFVLLARDLDQISIGP